MTGGSDAPNPLRRSLWPLSAVYGLGIWARNALFDMGARRVHRLSVPVVAVGNLSVGGTGKTPFVAWLVERARGLGRRPGVLARGYGRAPGAALNDEGMLLAARFPDLDQEQDPDRVRGGARLVERGVDLIVLDDGFQHRRLHRDRDLVCLDARRPFAGGLLLPAGNLREPRAALRRAHVAVFTRAGCIDPQTRRGMGERLRPWAGDELAVFTADHAPRDVVERPGERVHAVDWLAGRDVMLLSAIARPASFAETVEQLGARIVDQVTRRDHHRWSTVELATAAAQAKAAGAVLLTTEKDDVKIGEQPVERAVLRIDFAFLDGEPTPEQLGLR